VAALMLDQPTRGLAHDIGFMLARRYLQASKERYAWASLKTLAKEHGVARTSIVRAFDKLITGGWLLWEKGGQGAGDSNHYYLPDEIPTANKGSAGAPEGLRPRTIRVAPALPK
jgi:hypothetical protein